jgi:c-di-GMP-binding flagellar brake protein YcgR
MRGMVCIYDLQLLGEMKKVQRREAFRARESVEVSLRKVMPEQNMVGKWVNTRTIDISEAGMLVKFNEECAEGQPIEAVIRMKNHGLNEVLPKITARVIRCTANENKQHVYFLGVRFTEVPERAKNLLLKLVVLSQRSKIAYNQKRISKL